MAKRQAKRTAEWIAAELRTEQGEEEMESDATR
jgi:hypothetical protein